MAFINPDSAGRPATGQVASALWGDDIDDDLNSLAAPPCVRAFVAATAIATATETAVNLTSERWKNRAAMHSNSTNPSRVTPDLPGLYLVIGAANWAVAAGGHGLVLAFNGTAGNPGVWSAATTSGIFGDALTISDILLFNGVSDYVQLHVYQSSGGTINVAAELTVIKLSIETS